MCYLCSMRRHRFSGAINARASRQLEARSATRSRGDDALVLFSGGQDSATCLAWALERYDRVETIGFDYGQRHRIELDLGLTLSY